MTLWLSLSLMLAVAAILLVRPFLRRFSISAPSVTQNVALFKEQIGELDLEIVKGTVTEQEAEETRQEIERRALRVVLKSGGEGMNESNDTVRVIGIALTLGWLTVGSGILYNSVGRPDLATANSIQRTLGPSASLLLPAPRSDTTQLSVQEPLEDVNIMITRLATRLENQPGDIAGWRMLAWSYQRTNNLAGAVEAYARAVELAPDDDELLSLYGEAVTQANGGVVAPAAQEIFTRSLLLNPNNPRAGFFAGLVLEQAGQSVAALEKWLEILKRSPREADWVPGLIERIREVASAANYDLGDWTALLDTHKTPSQSPGNPTQDDIRAASEMTDGDRQAMILSMVDRLAERLKTTPRDPDGWSRLIRSYIVLEDRPNALQTLLEAREVFAQDPKSLAKIDETAAALGLR